MGEVKNCTLEIPGNIKAYLNESAWASANALEDMYCELKQVRDILGILMEVLSSVEVDPRAQAYAAVADAAMYMVDNLIQKADLASDGLHTYEQRRRKLCTDLQEGGMKSE